MTDLGLNPNRSLDIELSDVRLGFYAGCGLLIQQILLAEHLDEEQEERHDERSEDDAHEAEDGQARHDTEDGDKGMDVCHLLLQDEADQVVALCHNQSAVGKENQGMHPVAHQQEIDGDGDPDDGRPDDGDNGCESRQHGSQHRIGSAAEQVTAQRDDTLDDGEQRDADGIGTDDELHLVEHLALVFLAEGEDRGDVVLHRASAGKHEKEQHDGDAEVDDEVTHAAHDRLADGGSLCHDERQGLLREQVVARPLLDDGDDLLGRFDDALCVEVQPRQLADDCPAEE